MGERDRPAAQIRRGDVVITEPKPGPEDGVWGPILRVAMDSPGQVMDWIDRHEIGAFLFASQIQEAIERDHAEALAQNDPLRAGQRSALITMQRVLDGWMEGGMGECTQFHPSDIRNMIDDAARELGIVDL